MSDFRLAIGMRQAMANAAAQRVDQGGAPARLALYAGPVPASIASAPAGATLLAELVLGLPAFGAADGNGTIAANAITADASADATGTASFFRIIDGAGAVLFQGDVSAVGAGGDLQMPTLSISAGIEVAISSLTLTVPEA